MFTATEIKNTRELDQPKFSLIRRNRKMEKVFFDTYRLISMFTKPNRLSYEQAKFFEDGFKAIEIFHNDIVKNLVCWSYDNTAIFYETKEYWYCFSIVEPKKGSFVIEMTRFKDGTTLRWDTWENLNSCTLGADWLLKNHKNKYVKQYNS